MKKEGKYYLADWMADKITDEQLKLLVSADEFLQYKKLRNDLEKFEVAAPDLERNFNRIQQKIAVKKSVPTRKVFRLGQVMAIAASLLLAFGLFQTFYFSNTVTSDYGVTKTVQLKDQSKVTLNAKSELSYPNQFEWNRTLKLKGEAYFEVRKGSTFTVETAQGTVTVLGTKFNVIVEKDFFEVFCYEGKVRVTSDDKQFVLTKNKSVRVVRGEFTLNESYVSPLPTWMNHESSFVNVPFDVVIQKFMAQYNKKVDYPPAFKSVKFTGTFSNSNIETAVKSIAIPLQANYSIRAEKIVLFE